MKHLYYYLWVAFAHFYRFTSKMVANHTAFVMRLFGKSEEEVLKANERRNQGVLEWPGGVSDWHAFALYNLSLFLPLLILNLTILHFRPSKLVFLLIFGCFGAINAYFIYWRHEKWLKKRINKKAKEFYYKPEKR
jgi:hypothetical protein